MWSAVTGLARRSIPRYSGVPGGGRDAVRRSGVRLVAVGALIAASLLQATVPAAAQSSGGEQVDLELVLAVDVSGSMDRDEQVLQRTGYVEAIRHPEVVAAIRTGLIGRIAVTYMEWAGPSATRILVPWRVLDSQESADAFAAELAAAPVGTMRGTSISGGLLAAAALFPTSGYQGMRQVIDMSGDGPNNMGAPVRRIREEVLAQGIIINGLPIMLKRRDFGFGSIADLDEYYVQCVIGGPGAFSLPVRDPSQLVGAIRRKLILEIADLGGGATFVQAPPPSNPDYDCLVGERQRMQWYER